MGNSHSQINAASAATVVVSGLVLYGLWLALYRLYLCPQAKFPGPKLAALTYWYEVYYDIVSKNGGGQFTFEIKRMHEKYGPVVRINPTELHVDDPNYYNEIYCNSTSARPIDKIEKHKYRFNIPDATFSTVPAEHHRLRRAAIAPFFSKARVRNLNGNLQKIIDRISHRLATEYAGSGCVFNIINMWSSMTADVITELAFGRSADFSAAPDFLSPFTASMSNLAFAAHYNTHFGFLPELMNWLPDGLVGSLVPSFKPILDYRTATRQQLRQILSSKKDTAKESATPTIFHDILTGHLPPEELTLKRLTEEATSVNGAGMETVTWTLSVACFHILDQPAVLARLKTELQEAMPNPQEILPSDQLEKLPYLSAVVSEGLRLGYGAVQRLPRVNRRAVWKYGEMEIPAGVPVSMDAYHMHSNEAGPDGVHPLSHYLVPFSRGSRACIGMHLAYMELFIALATVFRRHQFELFETDRSDVDFANDLVRPMPKWGSKGVRVMVKQ
ncbi:cytochrome P450 [Aspergillus tanneri]|uniref:Cytochrome P450 n=1 Tax=Aspergillus tanneri TaxID=1220188 RepID=A0A5M9MBE5_9EURO|nr:uncharacterized protein ATNIH1004_009502 [Aspergillus tanneri]KAA8642750.1 hypothetical protein ATNIH1004_009502 [Aspergillus tanneri]